MTYQVKHISQLNSYNKPSPSPWLTLESIIKDIIGEDKKGVTFKASYDSSIIYGAGILHGIQMSVQDIHYKWTHRRVMIKHDPTDREGKNDTLDANSLVEKFIELAKLESEIAIQRADKDVRADKARELYNQFVATTNYTSDDPVSVWQHDAVSLKMHSYVNGDKLAKVEKILGPQRIQLKVIVLADKAKEIYDILS